MLNLKPILENHPEWIKDSKKLRSALNDLYPKNSREIDLLLDVLDDGIVDQIKKCNSINDRTMKSFVTILFNKHGIQYDLAAEAVKEWANVFDVPIVLGEKANTIRTIVNFKNSIIKLLKISAIIIVVSILLFVLVNITHVKDNYSSKDDVADQKEGIKPNLNSSSFLGEDYNYVITQLESAGFNDIETTTLQDLKKSEKELVGTVSEVSINGITTFSTSALFPKDSHVLVTYHEIDPNHLHDIQIPKISYYKGMAYIPVARRFQAAGFTNIELRAIYDVGVFTKTKQYELEGYYLEGGYQIVAGIWVSPDTKIIITYHEKKSNEKKAESDIRLITDSDVILRYSSSEYKDKDYVDVVEKIHKEGFLNIKTKKIKHGLLKKEGQTKSVVIDGQKEFDKGDIFSKYSEIIVTYYTRK